MTEALHVIGKHKSIAQQLVEEHGQSFCKQEGREHTLTLGDLMEVALR